MDVILLERIENLGQMGEVVSVKPGYARNFLLPRGKALRATKANKTYFESQRVELEAVNLKRRQEAETVAEKMDGLTLVVIRQAGESGQLYGSVSARDVAQAVTEAGFRVERSQVQMAHPIKLLGIHVERVALHPEVVVDVTVNVAQSDEQAKIQADQGGSAAQLAEREAASAAEPAPVVEETDVPAPESPETAEFFEDEVVAETDEQPT